MSPRDKLLLIFEANIFCLLDSENFIKHIGDKKCVEFLTNLVIVRKSEEDEGDLIDGWFLYTIEESLEDLPDYDEQMQSAIFNKLEELNLIKIECRGNPTERYLKIVFETITEILESLPSPTKDPKEKTYLLFSNGLLTSNFIKPADNNYKYSRRHETVKEIPTKKIPADRFQKYLRHYGTIKTIKEWEDILKIEFFCVQDPLLNNSIKYLPPPEFELGQHCFTDKQDQGNFWGWREGTAIEEKSNKKVFYLYNDVEPLVNKYGFTYDDFILLDPETIQCCMAKKYLDENDYDNFVKFMNKVINLPTEKTEKDNPRLSYPSFPRSFDDVCWHCLNDGILDVPNRVFSYFFNEKVFLSFGHLEFFENRYLGNKNHLMAMMLTWHISNYNYRRFYPEIEDYIRNTFDFNDPSFLGICLILALRGSKYRLFTEYVGNQYLKKNERKAILFYNLSMSYAIKEGNERIVSRLRNKIKKIELNSSNANITEHHEYIHIHVLILHDSFRGYLKSFPHNSKMFNCLPWYLWVNIKKIISWTEETSENIFQKNVDLSVEELEKEYYKMIRYKQTDKLEIVDEAFQIFLMQSFTHSGATRLEEKCNGDFLLL